MHCACAIFSSVACRDTICGEEVIARKMRVLNFSTTLAKLCLIIRITERDMIKNVYWPSCKVSVIHVRLIKNVYWPSCKVSVIHVRF